MIKNIVKMYFEPLMWFIKKCIESRIIASFVVFLIWTLTCILIGGDILKSIGFGAIMGLAWFLIDFLIDITFTKVKNKFKTKSMEMSPITYGVIKVFVLCFVLCTIVDMFATPGHFATGFNFFLSSCSATMFYISAKTLSK
jgi:phosphate starvation-inducible membrane PsiE